MTTMLAMIRMMIRKGRKGRKRKRRVSCDNKSAVRGDSDDGSCSSKAAKCRQRIDRKGNDNGKGERLRRNYQEARPIEGLLVSSWRQALPHSCL